MSKLSGLKVSKLSKMAKRLGVATLSRKESRDLWTSISGVESLRGSQSFLLFAVKSRGSHSFRDAETPGSLNGTIESKKSAE